MGPADENLVVCNEVGLMALLARYQSTAAISRLGVGMVNVGTAAPTLSFVIAWPMNPPFFKDCFTLFAKKVVF